MSEDLGKRLANIYNDLQQIAEDARASGLLGVERTVLHVLSHIEILIESLRKSEPGLSY